VSALLERAIALEVPTGAGAVHGDLRMPTNASGIVVFAHGSGSSRHSPRNRLVAEMLQRRGFGTLLMDLLTADEEQVDVRTRELRFDVDLLADRLVNAAAWLADDEACRGRPLGYFGASTGAAAALIAAARRPEGVAAVVSRGGRPDLADRWLEAVQAPTALIVGGNDPVVIELNQAAYDRLRVPRTFAVIPGATHLFEEPGALEAVARVAGDWFADHLGSGAGERP
jgi:putative phosphoribosyl transferase